MFDSSRMFFTKNVIFCEGISDQIFLEYENISKNINNEISNHEIIPIHGLDNVVRYYAIAKEIGIIFLFLSDKDINQDGKKSKFCKALDKLLQKQEYSKNIAFINEGELEDFLQIQKVEKSQKVENIMNNEKIINTKENGKKITEIIKKGFN